MKKYFLRYFIEFLVVFFGITISFSLQKLSNKNETCEKQKEGLERVLNDLKLDQTIFDLTLKTNKRLSSEMEGFFCFALHFWP